MSLAFTSFVTAFSGVTVRRGMLLDADHLFGNNDFSSGFGTPAIADYGWFGLSLAAPGAHYQCHLQDYTLSGAWSHGESVGAGPQPFQGVSDSIQVGVGVTAFSNGDCAVAGIWTSALSTAAIEAACTTKLSDFMAAQPAWAVAFPQASITNIKDLTGGGGDETSRSGTITAAANPPGYDFSLGTITNSRRAYRR